MSFTWKVVTAFGLASAILFSVGVFSYLRMIQTDVDQHWVAHTHAVRAEIEVLFADLANAETNQRGYIITGQENYLTSYREAVEDAHGDYDSVRNLTSDNSTQQASLKNLAALMALRLTQMEEGIRARQIHGAPAGIIAVSYNSETGIMDKLRAVIGAMLNEEDRLLAVRTSAAETSSRRMKFIIVFGYALAFVFLVAACMVVHHEMENRRFADQAAAQRSAELEVANKELEAFCYSVSHDLRTPLRGIDGFSQALLEDYGSGLARGAQDHLRRIRAAAQRMGRLIDDLLNLSRYTRAEIQKEPTDLAEIGRKVAAELRQSQPQRDAQVVIAPELRCQSDPQLMRVVLENLLGNAWKFTSKIPQARIEFGKTNNNGSSAFYVKDNGAGFNPAYASQLFGAFQRLHGVAEFPGTGVGLATVQRIIRRHGGRIWAESAVDEGATFYFTL
jgi:signal transduction histidine kinase